jgi:hypothetical protein
MPMNGSFLIGIADVEYLVRCEAIELSIDGVLIVRELVPECRLSGVERIDRARLAGLTTDAVLR